VTDDFDDLPEPDGDDFESAADSMIAQLRDRLLLNAEDFYALEAAARARAFTVSGVADLDVVAEVWRAIDAAVESGESLDDFRERVGELLADQWGEEDGARVETIFRTNVQTAYSAGRWAQNSAPAVRESHPYCRFVAVLDGRTSDICEDLHGTVLPADHPFWETHQPPLHHQCRSDVVPLTEDEAREEGVDDEAPEVDPDDGFGVPGAEFEPDLSSRPPELSAIYQLATLGRE
jgi:SPP1 gp7 family putative phage head morphogenesis protein